MRNQVTNLVPHPCSAIRHWPVPASKQPSHLQRENKAFCWLYSHVSSLLMLNWSGELRSNPCRLETLEKSHLRVSCSTPDEKQAIMPLCSFLVSENLNIKSGLLCIALGSQHAPTPALLGCLLLLDILSLFAFLISGCTKSIEGSLIRCSCYAFLVRSWIKHHCPCPLQAPFFQFTRLKKLHTVI